MKQIFTRQALLLIFHLIANWIIRPTPAQWTYPPIQNWRINFKKGLLAGFSNLSPMIRSLVLLLIFYSGGWCFPIATAQTYYPWQDLQQNPNPNLSGILGVMYNPAPYPVALGKTYYHNSANFFGTMYLLKPIDEYDGIHPMLPLSPYYTSGFAMCSQKIPLLELYAPIEVGAVDSDPVNGLLDKYYPFASIVTAPFSTGPFNKLPSLNESSTNFNHPLSDVLASSVLEATQKFTRLTHNFYGWDGFDKLGQKCITTLIDKRMGRTRYDYVTKIVHHNIASYSEPSVSRDLIGHELAHGILNYVPALGDAAYEGYEDNSIPLHELMEFFCDVMGLANLNYHDLPNGLGFASPNWLYGVHQGLSLSTIR
ncbi:hypothetical protein [Dyadobacter arcticus]|uniref:Uncharacterized protein n=1 Tax=Dyadobacter arcticus TaxID=1078754 RepID=A0ABX0UX63_9BACT|nr:hypothetical protein [Dyadobacter arcticus]NIJ56185.1 hypothetical protein [Dyadobacter arcticus]